MGLLLRLSLLAIAALAAPKVVVHEGTLEDVFMSLTGRHLRDA